jgi:hypothetical protein
LKSEDGSSRGLASATYAFLRRLGHDAGALAVTPVTNSRGEVVGEIVSE